MNNHTRENALNVTSVNNPSTLYKINHPTEIYKEPVSLIFYTEENYFNVISKACGLLQSYTAPCLRFNTEFAILKFLLV